MFTKKFIGWIGLVLFNIAAMIRGFLFLPTFLSVMKINAQFILLIAGVFALPAGMTSKALREMNDTELTALWLYLQSSLLVK